MCKHHGDTTRIRTERLSCNFTPRVATDHCSASHPVHDRDHNCIHAHFQVPAQNAPPPFHPRHMLYSCQLVVSVRPGGPPATRVSYTLGTCQSPRPAPGPQTAANVESTSRDRGAGSSLAGRIRDTHVPVPIPAPVVSVAFSDESPVPTVVVEVLRFDDEGASADPEAHHRNCHRRLDDDVRLSPRISRPIIEHNGMASGILTELRRRRRRRHHHHQHPSRSVDFEFSQSVLQTRTVLYVFCVLCSVFERAISESLCQSNRSSRRPSRPAQRP